MNFPPAESAAGPGAEHPDSILSGGEQRMNSDTHAEAEKLGKSPDLIQQRPTETNQAEKLEEKREGVGWLCHAAVISRFFCFFFPPSTYPLYTTSRRFALWEHSCQEWANRCGVCPKTTKQSQKVPGGRVLRCVSGPVGLLPFTTWKPAAFYCVSVYFLLPQIHSGDFNNKRHLDCHVFTFFFFQFCRFVIPEDKTYLHCTAFLQRLIRSKTPPHTNLFIIIKIKY